MTDYAAFLAQKSLSVPCRGFHVADADVSPMLYDWQRRVVQWACERGRAALFEDCGLGKTPQQLEWARLVAAHCRRKVIVLAPLAVAAQTVREGAKFGIPVTYARTHADAMAAPTAVVITNYDLLEHFQLSEFGGVVLDESSILKNYSGKTKQALVAACADVPYRLACTATPAPNDHLELGNHAQCLGIMDSHEMIMRWFLNDTMQAGGYRLKKHAVREFWQWVASWAVCASSPEDVGGDGAGFCLPRLALDTVIVRGDDSAAQQDGKLFARDAISAAQLWRERKLTVAARVDATVALVEAEPDEPWVLWVDTNTEADAITARLPGAVEVRGNDARELKERRLEAFAAGDVRVLVTKPDIAAFGLNWQHCARQVFVGMSYSFERLYQALRRSWRYGQTREVRAWMVCADTEGSVLRTVQRKQQEFEAMQAAMRDAMRGPSLDASYQKQTHQSGRVIPPPWAVPAWREEVSA